MTKLGWTNYYNEFSRIQGIQAKNNEMIFRLLPTEYGICLKLIDAYTGCSLKEVPCLDQNQALTVAENFNYKLSLGHSLNDIIS